MISLTRRFLIGVAATTVAVTTLASGAAFVVFQRTLEGMEVQRLTDYVAERGANESRRFIALTDVQHAAAAALARRMDGMPAAQAAALFDAEYPLQPDGTRRSRPQAFDGVHEADGDYLYGIGAFISNGRQVSPQDKAMWVAAQDLVGHVGEAIHPEYDNFYFYAPSTRLVLFGPDRPDRLMFYRHDAPASLDVSHEQMVRMVQPANNPAGVTRCTSLQRLVQDKKGERLATACATPAYVHGRFVGAFGSSIDLTAYFKKAVHNAIPGRTNLVVSGEGDLIAWPGFATPAKASEATVAAYEGRLGLKQLIARIRRDGRPFGVVEDNDRTHLVAYDRLSGPDWYLLITYPRSALAWSAARSAVWILALGLMAALAQSLLVVFLARRTLADPLRRLTADAAAHDGATPLADVEARDDEIGLLARALRTGRERAEEVLASLEERVRERTAQLEAANQEKSRFLANMSHELRTPLNGVIAVAELLALKQTDATAREQAELIASSGRLLERVLSDILDVSKIEAGQMRLEVGEFDVEVLAARIAELHRASAEAKGLELVWSVSPEAKGVYRGDPVRLTQIQSNLLSNAVKFTQAGKVELIVERTSEGLSFKVSDTGIGFDRETRERLFKRFEQADASITRRFGGTGLGLAICRSLAELMGGRVDVRSQPGEGSTFDVIVPLERCGDAVRTSRPAIVEPAPHDADDRPLRILLAEDHPTNQRVVKMILDASGHELVIVDNGREAVDWLRRESFDVVLMDMQMPELDGLSATRALRALERDGERPRTPVIMLTANALEEHVQAGRAAGADRHLSKPIRADALLIAIREVMFPEATAAMEVA